MIGRIPSFTLDTNCLIDLDDDDRPAKPYVLAIIEAARSGNADVAILASSASEQQPGGRHLNDFADFRHRLVKLGLGDLTLLRPLCRWDMTFHDYALYADEALSARERLIFETLFPTTPSEWTDYAVANSLEPKEVTSAGAWKWRNRLCDAQAFWCHEYYERDVFVTSDKNFGRRLLSVADFAAAVIKTPSEAVALLFDDQSGAHDAAMLHAAATRPGDPI